MTKQGVDPGHPFTAKLTAFNIAIGHVISWLTLLMVLIIFSVVVLRYFFNTGWIAMQESAIYLHAINFMLGSAFTLARDGHVRVDIFYQKFSPRGRAWVDLLGTLLLLLPFCVFIFWTSLDYVANAWQIHEASPEAGGLPWLYLLKSLLLLMPLLLLIQGFVWVLTSLQTLRTGTTQTGAA